MLTSLYAGCMQLDQQRKTLGKGHENVQVRFVMNHINSK